MHRLAHILALIACTGTIGAFAQTAKSDVPHDCAVTGAESARFTPPEPYQRPEAWGESKNWYGTSKLWTRLPADGHWRTTRGFLPKAVFREKLFWWREGYNPYRDATPNLIVTAQQLDGSRQRFTLHHATNAIRANIPAMLVMIDIPAVGCWKITGQYADIALSYVVWVGP